MTLYIIKAREQQTLSTQPQATSDDLLHLHVFLASVWIKGWEKQAVMRVGTSGVADLDSRTEEQAYVWDILQKLSRLDFIN